MSHVLDLAVSVGWFLFCLSVNYLKTQQGSRQEAGKYDLAEVSSGQGICSRSLAIVDFIFLVIKKPKYNKT